LHRSRPIRVPLKFDFKAFKEVVRIGMPFCFWGTLNTSLWLATEYSLMLHFAGVKEVGLFAVAVVLRESMNILPKAVQMVFAPRVIESFGREGKTGAYTKRLCWLSAMIGLFMLAVVYLAGEALDFLLPLFLPKYIDGLMLMKICFYFSIVQALSIPFSGLIATGRSWLFGKGILAGIAVFPIAAFLLEPHLGGMVAVVVASLMGRLVRTVVAYWDLFSLMRQEAGS
jgi:O-antigen/teichoic acid export membrane protein